MLALLSLCLPACPAALLHTLPLSLSYSLPPSLSPSPSLPLPHYLSDTLSHPVCLSPSLPIPFTAQQHSHTSPVPARARPHPRAPSPLASAGRPQLPPSLQKTVTAFKMVPDQKLRYQQLLFLAKKLEPMDPALAVDENKVKGCLSTVYVVGSIDEAGVISYVGQSDSQLTKGLAALLINGLSGSTNEQIQAVDPSFIHDAGLAQSLTPGRNNGFINMLVMMKRQAAALAEGSGIGSVPAQSSGPEPAAGSRAGDAQMVAAADAAAELGPIGQRMAAKLIDALAPTILEIVDESAQHAGHAGAKGLDGESHFALRIASPAFEGVGSLQRHKMVYAALDEEMKLIHALSIKAGTPAELGA